MITNKQTIISNASRHKTDTGSPEVQIAVLTERIAEITEHLKKNKHDITARRSLLKMVADRKKHLEYLKKHNKEVFEKVRKTLK